eukprot:g30973.t1
MGRWDRESLWDRSKCVPHARPLNRAPWDVWASCRATSSCDGSSSSGPGRSSSESAECISHVSGGSPVGSSTSSVASTSVGLHVLVDSVLPLDHRDVCSSLAAWVVCGLGIQPQSVSQRVWPK